MQYVAIAEFLPVTLCSSHLQFMFNSSVSTQGLSGQSLGYDYSLLSEQSIAINILHKTPLKCCVRSSTAFFKIES